MTNTYHVVLLTLPSTRKELAIYSVGSENGAIFSSASLEECNNFVKKNKDLETK
ncbi:MAG: hypothetical protein ICV78_21195 [Tolypothrix sp. Co-bin9]|nr:hypothetical protein [Tolypothrix sp. Co-bin9]